MSRNRFVRADTTRLDLSDGDWIEVKTELNYGEHLRINRASLQSVGMNAGEGGDDGKFTFRLDPFTQQQRRLEIYLTDWSFRDEDDKPVPLTRSTIEALDDDTAAEIVTAIEAHEKDVAAKKTKGAAPK